MNKQDRLYRDRWVMALAHAAETRGEPLTSSGYYSVRKPIEYRRPNGSILKLSQKHLCVWNALLTHVPDLALPRTYTIIGLETLSQQCLMTADAVGDCLDDLITVGFVRKKRRGEKRTNLLYLFLTPLSPDADDMSEEEWDVPVSVTPEAIGYYVCRAADKRSRKASESTPGTSVDVIPLINLLQQHMPTHPTFQSFTNLGKLSEDLRACVQESGTIDRCLAVIKAFLESDLPEVVAVTDEARDSPDLGAHFRENFPTWWVAYEGPLPGAD